MCHKQFYQRTIAACIATVVLGGAISQAAFISLDPNNSADSVLLSDLIDGTVEGVSVGDKSFSEFFYNTLQNDMPEADKINVFGFVDSSGNFGVSFHGAFIDLPGGGPSDALLRFTVEVSPEAIQNGYRISDAHLFVGGIGVGDNSVFTVDESFQSNNSTMNVFATTLGGDLVTQTSDWVYFDELHTKLRVTKDIFALAGEGSNLPARATVIDQSFSQEIIPEPTTLGLLGLGMLGIFLSKREF